MGPMRRHRSAERCGHAHAHFGAPCRQAANTQLLACTGSPCLHHATSRWVDTWWHVKSKTSSWCQESLAQCSYVPVAPHQCQVHFQQQYRHACVTHAHVLRIASCDAALPSPRCVQGAATGPAEPLTCVALGPKFLPCLFAALCDEGTALQQSLCCTNSCGKSWYCCVNRWCIALFTVVTVTLQQQTVHDSSSTPRNLSSPGRIPCCLPGQLRVDGF